MAPATANVVRALRDDRWRRFPETDCTGDAWSAYRHRRDATHPSLHVRRLQLPRQSSKPVLQQLEAVAELGTLTPVIPDDLAKRAAHRADWPIQVVRRGEERPDGLETTPEQRIEMMWELAVRAYGMAGIPIPDYARADTPIRVVRRGEEDS